MDSIISVHSSTRVTLTLLVFSESPASLSEQLYKNDTRYETEYQSAVVLRSSASLFKTAHIYDIIDTQQQQQQQQRRRLHIEEGRWSPQPTRSRSRAGRAL